MRSITGIPVSSRRSSRPLLLRWQTMLTTWDRALQIRLCPTLERSRGVCCTFSFEMSKINEISKLNQMELENDIPFEQSWHQAYKNCPWVFFGGLSTELSEGDIITMFSQ